ncbi:MAG: S8 family serine peptidase, partial [Gammaproteobacteria bacterium]
LSTVPGGGYSYFSGTSMATPHVSGAAALVLAQAGAMPPSQLRMRLMATSDPIPSLTGRTISGGRLNLFKAISPCPPTVSGRPGIAPGFIRYLGEDTILTNTVFQGCGGAIGAAAIAGFNNGDPNLVMSDNGVTPDKVSGDAIYTGKWRPGIGGTAQSGPVVVTFVASTTGSTSTVPVSGNAIDRISYSRNPASFAWSDISLTGLTLPLSDESFSTVQLPFSFKYYGLSYNSVTVSSNGALNFEGKAVGYTPVCIPGRSSNVTQRIVAPFWDDLYPGVSGGTVKYQVMGSQPNRSLIIQWTNVLRYPSSPNGVSFQAILYEGNNQIAFQYQDTLFGLPGSDKGATAVSGIQDDPTNGVKNSCFAPDLNNSTAVLFIPGRGTCGVSLPLGITPTALTFGLGTNRPVTGNWALGLLLWTGSG